MNFRSRFPRAILGFVGALAVSSSLVLPAVAAAPTVTQQINSAGSLYASVSSATLQAVQYSNTQSSSTGALDLTVNDPTGTSAGWNVTIQSSNFVYSGSSPSGQNIPASDFSITSVGTPQMTAGQTVDSNHGPRALSGAIATLDQVRKTIAADPGYGSGNYTQNIPVQLVIPAMSQAGTYTATLTVQIAAAP
jgi:hypothetical protein